MSKSTYEHRKSLGLCVYCGLPTETKGVSCDKCKEVHKKMRYENKQYAEKHKICNRCFRNKVEVGKICLECLDKAADYREEHREQYKEYNARYAKERKERLKEQGICVACGKRKVKSGKTMCHYCLDSKMQYIRRYNSGAIKRSERVAYGLCYFCGSELSEGQRICDACKNRVSANLPKESTKNEYWEKQNKLIFKQQN